MSQIGCGVNLLGESLHKKLSSCLRVFLPGLLSFASYTCNLEAQGRDNALPPFKSCNVYSDDVYNMAAFIKPSQNLINEFSKLVSSGDGDGRVYVTANIPLVLEAARGLSGQDPYFSDSDLASAVMGGVLGNITYPEMSKRLRDQLDLVARLTQSESVDPIKLRAETIRLFDLARSYPVFVDGMEISGFFLIKTPLDFEQALSLARARSGPGSVLAAGLLLMALEQQGLIGQKPSINELGWSALHRNRIFQDLLFIGYPCSEARTAVSRVDERLLMKDSITATVTERSIRYRAEGGEFEFPFYNGFVNRSRLDFPVLRRGFADMVVRGNPQPRGEVQVGDFAVGAMNRITMDVIDPAGSTAAINLITRLKDRQFTLTFNSQVASRLGVPDLVEQIRRTLKSSGVDLARIEFKELALSDSEVLDYKRTFGYPWTRDLWLSALKRDGTRVKLQHISRVTPPFTPTLLSSEGGAQFPLGRFIFLTQRALNQGGFSSFEDPWNPAKLPALTDAYLKEFGRIPIVVDTPTKTFAHVDVYSMFLPQPNGRPVIGVADLRYGQSIVYSIDTKSLLRDEFLSRSYANPTDSERAATISSINPAGSGTPWYHYNTSFASVRNRLSARVPAADVFDADNLDYLALQLRRQGFTVFRFPYFPGLSMANGLTEVSAESGANFYAPDSPPFNRIMASLVNSYGYSLRLLPRGFGISDGAGYHCRTNEDRNP